MIKLNIKKMMVFLAVFVLLSSIVLSLTPITRLITGPSSILTFEGNSDRKAEINIWGHSYVMNVSMTVRGMLSDWVTVAFYNASLRTPYDAEYINSNLWLVSDSADLTDNIQLISMPNKIILKKCDGFKPSDVDYINNSWIFISELDNNRVSLLDLGGGACTVLKHYNISQPYDAEYINETAWLIASQGEDKVIQVDVSGGSSNYPANTVLNYSVNNPYDVEYLSYDNTWLITQNNNIIKLNIPSLTINRTYSISGINFDIENVNNGQKWLVTNENNQIILLNTSSNATLNVYDMSLNNPKDAKYISDNEWLITDSGGSKRVSLEKKYYPTNLSLNVGNDSDIEWNMAGELQTAIEINDTKTLDFSREINEFLDTCILVNNNCTIPFAFHSDTYGKLNVSLNYVTVNRKPTVQVLIPNGGENLSGTQNVSWLATDDDNDNLVMKLYYWDTASWIWLNTVTNTQGQYEYSWDTTTVPNLKDSYKIKVNATDPYAPVVEDESNSSFTIDNEAPTINVTYPAGGEILNGIINIAWLADDNFDNALDISLEYSTDGVIWNIIDPSTSNTAVYPWNSVAVDSNSVLIRTNATDDAGNENSSVSTGTFTVDNTAPNIVISNPVDGYNETNNNTIVFNFSATDSVNNSFMCELYIDGVLQESKTVNSGIVDNFTKTLAEDTFIWSILCYDGINYGSSGNRTLTVDTMILTPSFLPTGTITSDSWLLQVIFNEAVNLINVTFDNNSIALSELKTADNMIFNLSVDSLASGGTYELIVNATDLFNHNGLFSNNYVVSYGGGGDGDGGGGGGGTTTSNNVIVSEKEGKEHYECGDGLCQRPFEDCSNCYEDCFKTCPDEGTGGNETAELESEVSEIPEEIPEITGAVVGGVFDNIWKLLLPLLVLIAVISGTYYLYKKKNQKNRGKEPPEESSDTADSLLKD